jgi:ribosomal-protein-alanine N-acetyltransferase
MPHLELVADRHATELLRFELQNREFFARTVTDRGDEFFAQFDQRHAALIAEQTTGRLRFHVLVDDDGAVLGRFNLYEIQDGTAELGYRVAERAAGQGMAKLGVRAVSALARDDYGLDRLTAAAARDNAASLGVLRATGFVPVGELEVGGRAGLLHRLDLTLSTPR